MKQKISRADPEAGFTLLELLVSITLLGFLSILLFGSLKFGTTVWERATDAASDSSKLRLMQLQLRSELERIYPAFESDLSNGAHVSFEGTSDSLSYLAPDANDLPGSLSKIRLSFEEGKLVRHTKAELAPAGVVERETILSRGFAKIEFAYFGPDRSGKANWQTSWKNRTSLPKLIRLSFLPQENAGQPIPDLTVAPRIAVDAGCVFDQLTKYCQGRS